MINPVEIISRSRTRLARLAATRVVITGLPVIAVTIGLGFSVNPVARQISHRWGYLIDPSHLATLRTAVFVAAGLGAIVAAFLAWRAWNQANDFEQAAEKMDALIGAHQELLTLATLADPSHPETKDQRSPLFAVLWRRAIGYLERFDPNREFTLEALAPLKRSTVLAVGAAAILALAMFALMRAMSPTEALVYNLREAAENIPSSSTPGGEQLAAAERDVANDLDNPKLPPEQKLAEIESIKQEIEKPQQAASLQSGAGNSKGNGSGTGEASGSGAGEGTGGQNEKGAGAGPGLDPGGGGKGGNKSDQQQATLKNDIDKAQAKLESEVSSDNQSKTTPTNQSQKGGGFMPQAGNNPHQAGPQAGPNGTDNAQVPQPGQLGQSQAPPSSSNASTHKDDNGTQGDTHLGDFPKAVAYERYKLGDKGLALDLKNARYVTFRIPPSTVSNGAGGRIVHDASVSAATTPYTNAPLKDESLVAAPDEEQLLPPRYRDLIR